jgi:hypothetical protein
MGGCVLCAVMFLTACSGTAATATASVQSTSEALSTGYQDALPAESQLALGTLMLESGENAIDSQTASQLLPLWKAVRSLSVSDTVSDLEMQALFEQIEASMSTEQVEAIAAMQLTASDLSQTIATFEVQTSTSASASSTQTANAAGGGPGGGQAQMGDMAGGMGDVASMSGGTTGIDTTSLKFATQDSTGILSGNSATLSTAVVNAVITMLETKVQA